MGSTLTTVKWSLDDYHRMIEAGILGDRRAELLRGEIVETAPEGKPHEYWVVHLKTMELVVFTELDAGRYQQQQTFTEGWVSPVAFADVRFAVNQFVRR